MQRSPVNRWVRRLVAVEVTAVGVSQSHKEIPPHVGSPVWTAVEWVAMAANLVTFCCGAEPLGRMLTCEPAVLAGILHASSLVGTTQSHCCSSSHCTSARNLEADLQAACALKCQSVLHNRFPRKRGWLGSSNKKREKNCLASPPGPSPF